MRTTCDPSNAPTAWACGPRPRAPGVTRFPEACGPRLGRRWREGRSLRATGSPRQPAVVLFASWPWSLRVLYLRAHARPATCTYVHRPGADPAPCRSSSGRLPVIGMVSDYIGSRADRVDPGAAAAVEVDGLSVLVAGTLAVLASGVLLLAAGQSSGTILDNRGAEPRSCSACRSRRNLLADVPRAETCCRRAALGRSAARRGARRQRAQSDAARRRDRRRRGACPVFAPDDRRLRRRLMVDPVGPVAPEATLADPAADPNQSRSSRRSRSSGAV